MESVENEKRRPSAREDSRGPIEIRLTDSKVGERDEDAGNDPVDPGSCSPSEAEAADSEADSSHRAGPESDLRDGDSLALGNGVAVKALLNKKVPDPAH
jgi:hypothetical protein